jgi:hypothetical protein
MLIAELALLPHPATGAGPVRALTVSAALSDQGQLQLDYQLHGELDLVRCPQPADRPQRRDELWRHTCLELFVQPTAAARYLEFNFSPSGDWAAFEFQAYRSGRRDFAAPGTAVALAARSADRLLLRAQADLAALCASAATRADPALWRLNFSAVIEAVDGSLSHWALHHAQPEPDFHHRGGFRAALTDPQRAAPAQAGRQ